MIIWGTDWNASNCSLKISHILVFVFIQKLSMKMRLPGWTSLMPNPVDCKLLMSLVRICKIVNDSTYISVCTQSYCIALDKWYTFMKFYCSFVSFLELVHIIFVSEVYVESKPTDKQAVTGFYDFPVTDRMNQCSRVTLSGMGHEFHKTKLNSCPIMANGEEALANKTLKSATLLPRVRSLPQSPCKVQYRSHFTAWQYKVWSRLM